MVLTTVLYINDLTTVLGACHVQCQRHYRESQPYVLRNWSGMLHRQGI